MTTVWHNRLLEVVEELEGGTLVDIKRRFVEKYGENFAAHDCAIINGTSNWWRKVLWARNDLVKEGKLVYRKIDAKHFIPTDELPSRSSSLSFNETVIIYATVVLFVILALILQP